MEITLINYNNCSIKIKAYYFSNTVENVKQNEIFNNIEILKNFTNKLSFEQIEQEHRFNVKNIKVLNYHKKITYSCNIFIIIVIIIIIHIIFIKHKYITVKLNTRIQEYSNLKGGVVTYTNPDKIDQFIETISK